jgi:hypothetical protein
LKRVAVVICTAPNLLCFVEPQKVQYRLPSIPDPKHHVVQNNTGQIELNGGLTTTPPTSRKASGLAATGRYEMIILLRGGRPVYVRAE